MNALVVAMCGLPGAGKTTLTCAYVNDTDTQTADGRQVQVERICFDDMLSTGVTATEILPESDFDPTHWKRVQQAMAALVRERIAQHRNGNQEGSGNDTSQNFLLVLMVDDNFPYRSFRKRFCQIAMEALGCGFSILFMDTPVHVCYERNARRNGSTRMPEHVMQRMVAAFEPPTEKKAVIVDGEALSKESVAMQQATRYRVLQTLISQAREQYDTYQRTASQQALQLCQAKLDRERTTANAIHNVDIAVRRWMSSVIQGRENIIVSERERGAVANLLNAHRKSFLASLKDRQAQDQALAGRVIAAEECNSMRLDIEREVERFRLDATQYVYASLRKHQV